jgi:hypothetical protein
LNKLISVIVFAFCFVVINIVIAIEDIKQVVLVCMEALDMHIPEVYPLDKVMKGRKDDGIVVADVNVHGVAIVVMHNLVRLISLSQMFVV